MCKRTKLTPLIHYQRHAFKYHQKYKKGSHSLPGSLADTISIQNSNKICLIIEYELVRGNEEQQKKPTIA